MTIIQALKKKGGAYRYYVLGGYRDLHWDSEEKRYAITEHIEGKPKKLLGITKDQNIAVDFLLGKR